MRNVVPALVAVAVMVAATAPPATAASSIGVSVGATKMGPAGPWTFDALQQTSNFRLRFDAGSPYTELMFGFVNRTQALAPSKAYVFETSGLSVSAGARYGFLRAGVGLEAAWLRQILVDAANPSTLRFHNGGGFILEPYVGVLLPVLKTEVTELELSIHYPVGLNSVDPAIGPRMLLTLWLGGEGLEDDEEDEEEEDEEAEEELEDDEEEEEEEAPAVPAPKPSAAPVQKPLQKPAPKPTSKPTVPTKPKPRK